MDLGWDQAAVARAEERRCAVGTSEIAGTAEPFAGGFLCFDAPDSFANEAVGVGFEPLETGQIDHLVGFYAERGAPARVVLAPTAHRSWVEGLREAGFGVKKFENVLFRPLPPGEDLGGALPHGWPAGVRVRPVRRDDPADVRRHAETVAAGFAGPGGIDPAEVAFGERVVAHPRTVALVAEIDGEVVGAGCAEATPPVGGLFSLSVRPAWRRRGIQQALMAARMEALRARGCEIATICSEPGVPTERNARRMGFALAYTRVTLVRQPDGARRGRQRQRAIDASAGPS